MNDVHAVRAGGDEVDTGSLVDRHHPWLGLASFSEDTRAYFFGREDEVAELARRVQRKLLTILFGQSGLGKTSILRAGLVPKLRPEGYCPIYVRLDYAPESPPPAEQIKQAIVRETASLGRWTQTGVAVAGESLWEFLHHRDDVLLDAQGRTIVPLLIFDQFEEVFTIAQGDAQGRERAAQFLADLADLVENRPPKALEALLDDDDAAIERFDFARADYRVLIALREDYLAHLESLKGTMPAITQNRMRLARMTGAQALAAVTRPGGRLVAEEVAEAIVRFVAGGAELRNAEVEPALLSLVCRELNTARIAQGRNEISADVLAGSRESILTEFYERALADQPESVRRVIEEHLLTESGYRESLAEERLQKLLGSAGAEPGTLARLVDRRLLRVEERLDVRRVELTHDVLTGVVKASRDVRLEREAREAAEHKLAAQRERERATRRALVRARQIAAGCGVLAVVAIASAVYGYFATERAKAAEAKAKDVRVMAEQARGEAEKLVVYLLDDFQLELAPVGRLDIVASLAKRAIDYYDALPPALRTSETDRNRALAMVRYATALRTQARLADSGKAVEEAIRVLDDLQARGDRSDLTVIGLATALSTRARLASSLDMDADGLPSSQRALDLLGPHATAQGASVALLRAWGEANNMHGFLQLRSGEYEAALATLERARDAFRAIADLDLRDPSAIAAYADATTWQVDARTRLGRMAEAEASANEAMALTDRVLQVRPGHMGALRARALAASPLAYGFRQSGRVSEALAMADVAQRSWRELTRLDPANAISWNNLAVSYFIKGDTYFSMGRLSDAARTHREALTLEREAGCNLLLCTNLLNQAARVAQIERALGDEGASGAALATSRRLRAWTVEQYGAKSFERERQQAFGWFWPTVLAWEGADHDATLANATAFFRATGALAPPRTIDRHDLARWSAFVRQAVAETSYLRGELAAADDAIGVAQALRRELTSALPDKELLDEQMSGESVAALVLAGRGRPDDARGMAAAALAYWRDRTRSAPEHAEWRLHLALALYAWAAAGAPDAGTARAEAARILDALPVEMRRSPRVATWRQRVAVSAPGPAR